MTQSASAALKAPKPELSLTADVLPLFAAVLLSAPFLISGAGKLAAVEQTIGYIKMVGLPMPPAAFAVAVAVELGGGLALVLGWRARTAAVALAAFCLVTGLAFHHDFSDQNNFIHFLKNIGLTGGLLYVAAYGRGRLGLDGRRA